MSLLDRLQADMKLAMKAKDKLKLGVIRLTIAAIKKEAIDKREAVDEAGEIALVQRAVKQRNEAAEAFAKGGRQDAADTELAEAAVLQEYLPTQLSDEELEAAAREMISSKGAASKGDLGKVMGPLMAKYKGQVDGNRVREAVSRLLSD